MGLGYAVSSPISREAPPPRSNFQLNLVLNNLGLHGEQAIGICL
jgi:hypothetical protein